jgi:hypothetical protein
MQLLALAVLAGLLALVLAGAARAQFDLLSAFGALFTGWRPDPWPRGVQEEDRHRRWGAPTAGLPTEGLPPPLTATPVRVRPTVRAR